MVNWGEKVLNTVCAIKVAIPLKFTHTTYSLQISRQETQLLVRPNAAAFDKVQVQKIHGQFDHDQFSNKTLETYENVLSPNVSNFKIISK